MSQSVCCRIFLTTHDSQPFTSDIPCGDIYEMISPDILHQLIKGTFKDHLVTWICEYFHIWYGEHQASIILDDIDQQYIHHISLYTGCWLVHSIAAVPPFPGLRRFPHGRRFKQWTGDDSKALIKVRLIHVQLFCMTIITTGLSTCDRGLHSRRYGEMSLSISQHFLYCSTSRNWSWWPCHTWYYPWQILAAVWSFLDS